MIGEITVITTFSSGEDENHEVMMIMKSVVAKPMVIRDYIFRTSYIGDIDRCTREIMMKFTISRVSGLK